MVSVTLKLSTVQNKKTGKSEILLRYRSHNATRVSELNVEDLIEFVSLYMDKGSSACMSELQREVFGIPTDWTEVSKWVEKAYESGRQFRYRLIIGESAIAEESKKDRLEYYLF